MFFIQGCQKKGGIGGGRKKERGCKENLHFLASGKGFPVEFLGYYTMTLTIVFFIFSKELSDLINRLFSIQYNKQNILTVKYH